MRSQELCNRDEHKQRWLCTMGKKVFFFSKGDIPPLIAVSFVKMPWMLHFLPLLNLDNTSQTILTAIMYFTWKWFPKLVPKVKKFRSVNLLKMDYITYVSWKTLDGCHNLLFPVDLKFSTFIEKSIFVHICQRLTLEIRWSSKHGTGAGFIFLLFPFRLGEEWF